MPATASFDESTENSMENETESAHPTDVSMRSDEGVMFMSEYRSSENVPPVTRAVPPVYEQSGANETRQ